MVAWARTPSYTCCAACTKTDAQPPVFKHAPCCCAGCAPLTPAAPSGRLERGVGGQGCGVERRAGRVRRRRPGRPRRLRQPRQALGRQRRLWRCAHLRTRLPQQRCKPTPSVSCGAGRSALRREPLGLHGAPAYAGSALIRQPGTAVDVRPGRALPDASAARRRRRRGRG